MADRVVGERAEGRPATVHDEVLRELDSAPEGLTDGELAIRLGKIPQHVTMVCRQLAAEGVVSRDDAVHPARNRLVEAAGRLTPDRTDAGAPAGPRGGPSVRPLMELPAQPPLRPPVRPPVGPPVVGFHREWHWKGGVRDTVVRHLKRDGWSIVRVADAARWERGVDVIAEREGLRLLVEVKGWPAAPHVRRGRAGGEYAGQPGAAQPGIQAAQWFAEGLLTLMRFRGPEPAARLALALPDMPRYRGLASDVRWALDLLEITVLLVDTEGKVTTWG